MMTNSKGSNDEDITTPSLHDEEILCEILSRSSVKSLMQFKCVCKRWRYLIEEDLYFIHVHLSRSKPCPALLINGPSNKQRGAACFFLVEDLFEGGAAEYRLTTSGNTHSVLEPVNGLICFANYVEGVIRIYNLSTREETPWIRSSIIEVEKEEKHDVVHQVEDYLPWYGFGFDPATKQHKVLCVWRIVRPRSSPSDGSVQQRTRLVCEVLIVGDNTWRRIDEVPPNNFMRSDPVYVNGSIYWLNTTSSPIEDQHPDAMNDVIVAFDVGREKFRVIPLPSFIIDRIPKDIYSCYVNLLEVDGHIALSHPVKRARPGRIKIKMWIFDDKEKTSSSSSNWIEETISMSFDGKGFDSLQAIAGSSDLIMIKPVTMIDVFSLYLYDRKKKTSRKVEYSTNHHDQIISREPACYSYNVAPFVKSLLPVQKQPRWHDDALTPP